MYPHWTEKDVDVNGVRIHYTRTGDGSKPPLVLAHGFSDNGMCWLPVARELEAEYDVILPDARGHGKSARVQPGELLDAPADLAGLIRLLGLQKPLLGGHSMGAGVSAALAAQYPDIPKALLLEDPPWREPQPESAAPPARPASFGDWLKELEGKSIAEMVEGCRKDNPGWPEVELVPWAESKQQLDRNFLQVDNNLRRDWRALVPEIRCPVLVLTAEVEKGAIVSEQTAAAVRALNPRLQIVKIGGAGHSIRRENFTDFMAAVRPFLAANR